MTIFLVQHGKSVPKEEDPDRPLSGVGVQQVEEVAAQLKEYNINLEAIFHTSKPRAIQTAEIIYIHVNAAQGMKEIEGMNPKDDVRLFAKNITKTNMETHSNRSGSGFVIACSSSLEH